MNVVRTLRVTIMENFIGMFSMLLVGRRPSPASAPGREAKEAVAHSPSEASPLKLRLVEASWDSRSTSAL